MNRRFLSRNLLAATVAWNAIPAPEAAASQASGTSVHAPLRLQLAELARGSEPYHDFANAKARGWKQFGKEDTPLMGEHWFREGGPDYVHGDDLDFSQPSNLMYTEIAGEKVLTGVAYTVRLAPGEPLPAGFAVSDDRWHVHDFEAAIDAALQDRPVLRWLTNRWIDAHYRAQGDDRGRVAMVHAWVALPNPDGMFADYNRTLPYLKLGLPVSFSEGATLEAARGLNLATKDGCTNGLDGALWIANVGRKSLKRLKAVCVAAARQVLDTISSGDAAAINATAERSWRTFNHAWQDVLSPEQQRRISAMNEHGSEHHEGVNHQH